MRINAKQAQQTHTHTYTGETSEFITKRLLNTYELSSYNDRPIWLYCIYSEIIVNHKREHQQKRTQKHHTNTTMVEMVFGSGNGINAEEKKIKYTAKIVIISKYFKLHLVN